MTRETTKTRVWVALCVVAGLLGCAPDSPEDAADASPDSGQEGPTDEELLDEFFSLGSIHSLALELDDDSWQTLLAEPKTYVHGRVAIDEEVFEDVGVRLKGSLGSFVPLDEEEAAEGSNCVAGKSGFIVDFNRWVKGLSFHGLKKLTVNNIRQDPTGVHQFLGYELFRAADIPGSRSGFARVSINGEDKYLYALVESADNSELLRRWYGSKAGNLYEGEGSDLTGDSYESFDQDSGDDTSKSDLAALVEVLDGLDGASDIYSVLEQHLDMERYLLFAAIEIYLGHWDGYAWSQNNFMIFNPEEGAWTFMPWGIDQLFDTGMMETHAGIMKGPGPSWEAPAFGVGAMFDGGRMQKLCFQSGECMSRLHDAYGEVFALVEEMGLEELYGEARALAEPVRREEAQAHGSVYITEYYFNLMDAHFAGRESRMREWMPCLVGQKVDFDADGHDGCTADCDDREEEIFPGAQELCNLEDDDCNGIIDDAAECPDCMPMTNAYGDYELCFHPTTWADAGSECASKGMTLTSVHSEEEMAALSDALLNDLDLIDAWIGLSDTENEGTFAWTDGTDLDFENWIIEMPEEWADQLDCVRQTIWLGWIPWLCFEEKPYICKAP